MTEVCSRSPVELQFSVNIDTWLGEQVMSADNIVVQVTRLAGGVGGCCGTPPMFVDTQCTTFSMSNSRVTSCPQCIARLGNQAEG